LLLFSKLVLPKKNAIKCGQLLDVKTGQIKSNQLIIIKNNLIDQIIDSKSFGQKVDTIIDLSNFTILPGLIDCHTHVLLQGDITSEDYDVQVLKESIPYRTIRAVNSCKHALMNGFTTIRDHGTEGAGFANADLKKAINTIGHYQLKASDYSWELTMPKGLQKITGADEGRRAVQLEPTQSKQTEAIKSAQFYKRRDNGHW